MTLLPKPPRRSWPKHEAWVRRQGCIVPFDLGECRGPIQCCHYRTAANSGKGIKPHSWFTFGGCHWHHAEQHQHGQEAFMRRYGVDLGAVCRELALRSPDRKMVETMLEWEKEGKGNVGQIEDRMAERG